jgi:uncharacterized protein (DUF1330 family)
MTAYVIARIQITDPEAFETYRQQVAPTIAAFGGTYLVRGGRMEVLEGESRPRIVVLSFPSYQQAKRWYESDAYAGPLALRHQSAMADVILVAGTDEPG